MDELTPLNEGMSVNLKSRAGAFFKNVSVAKLSVLAVLSLATVVSVNLAQRKTFFGTSAAGENVQIAFEPAQVTMPQNSTVKLVLDSGTFPVGFARVDVAFDRTKVNLAGEVTVTDRLKTQIQVTSMAEANSTGKVSIILGIATADRLNPPIGRLEFAQLPFKSMTTTVNEAASVTVDTSSVQVVDLNYSTLTVGAAPLSVSLNPVPTNTPIPTPTAQPDLPVATATPGGIGPNSAPSATPIPTATPTSTPVPTVTPTSTPRPTATPVPTATPTPRPTATPTPRPTATPTPRPTATPTPRPTATPTPTLRPTATPTPTLRPTATPTATPRPTNTPIPPTSTPQPTTAPIPGSGSNLAVVVRSAGDDVNEDGTFYSSQGSMVWMGVGESTNASYLGLRFTGVNIPRGSRITNARLKVYVPVSAWINMSLSIKADNTGDSKPFGSSSRPSGRSMTSSGVNYSANERWTGNSWVEVANLASVIQEVVNRSDWQSGNSLSIIARGTGSQWGRKYIAAFERGAGTAPTLEIEIASGGSQTQSTTQPGVITVPSATPRPTSAVASSNMDLNGSGCVDSSDLSVLLRAYGSTNKKYDFDGSGKVDFGDVWKLVSQYGKGCN